MLHGDIHGLGPHVVVLGIGFSLAVRDGSLHEADCRHSSVDLEDKHVVVGVVIILLRDDVPQLLQVAYQLPLAPGSPGQEDESREDAGLIIIDIGFRTVGPSLYRLEAFLDHPSRVLVLGVQLRPPLSIGYGLLLLSAEVLVTVCHAHVPLGLVLALATDGFEDLQGVFQGPVRLVIGGALVVVSDDGVVLQRTDQRIAGAVVHLFLRDGLQYGDAAGVLILIVPLRDLVVERFGILRIVGDVIDVIQIEIRIPVLVVGYETGGDIHGEYAEERLGHTGIREELLRRIDDGLKVPCDEIQVSVAETCRSADEGDCIRSRLVLDGLLEAVAEVEYPVAPVITVEGVEGIGYVSRDSAVGVEGVDIPPLAGVVIVDDRRTAVGSGYDVETPRTVRVLVWIRLVHGVSLQVGIGIVRQNYAQVLDGLGQVTQPDRLPLGKIIDNLEALHLPHVGDLADEIVDNREQHPPDLVLVLHGTLYLVAVDLEGYAVLLCPLHPYIHVVAADVEVEDTQVEFWSGRASDRYLPVLQHGFRGMISEVYVLEQPGLVALSHENEVMFPFIDPELEGRVVQRYLKDVLDSPDQLLGIVVPSVGVHHPADLRFLIRKHLPGLGDPVPEALAEPGQGHHLPASVDELLDVLLGIVLRIVSWMKFQRLLEVGERLPLPLQVEERIPCPEVPAVVVSQLIRMGPQQIQGLPVLSPSLNVAGLSEVVVRSGQFHVDSGRTFILGHSLQCLHYPGVFPRLVPRLALFEQPLLIHHADPTPSLLST